MKTKHIAIYSILSLLLLSPMFLANITEAAVSNFSDVSSTNQYYQAIMFLKDKGVISGYSDGTFKPNQEVSRVEALKIVLLGSNIQVPDTTKISGFKDTSSSQWYNKYLVKALELKIVNGYPDGTFKPTQTVNLAENLKMLINTKGIEVTSLQVTEPPFEDVPSDQWYSKFMLYAKDHKWITANNKNLIYPSQNITRGKLAQIIYNSWSENQQNSTQTTKTTQPTTQQTTQATQTQSQTQTTNDTSTTQLMNIKITSTGFNISSLEIASGTTVRWTNTDTVNHAISGDNNEFVSPTLTPGQTFQVQFNTIGTVNYHDSVFSNFKAQIVVKNPNEIPTI